MTIRTRAGAALLSLAVAVPLAAVGTDAAQAARTTPAVNTFARVAALGFTPTAVEAAASDVAYVSGTDAQGKAVLVAVTSAGRTTRVTSPTGSVAGSLVTYEGAVYLLQGDVALALDGAKATRVATLTPPATIPGLTPVTSAPLQFTFEKAVGGRLYFRVLQDTVPVSPGHYFGVAVYDHGSWYGSMDAAALTGRYPHGLDVLADGSVRVRELEPSYGFVYGRHVSTSGVWSDDAGWTQPGPVERVDGGARYAYPAVTTTATATTLWGYVGAVGDGWRTPTIPLHGTCTTTAPACTPTDWAVSAATQVGTVAVLGGTDAVGDLTAPVGGGYAVVPTQGATPVTIAGDNGDAVVTMDAAPTGNRVWSVVRTGTTYSLQTALIDASRFGGPAPARATTSTSPKAVLGRR